MKVEIENTKSGEANLFIIREGKRHPVYSRGSPGEDGLRFFHSLHDGRCDFYIFLGLGLGYHIAPFVRERGVKKIVILEPSTELFDQVRRCAGVREVLEHPKVTAFSGDELEGFIDGIRSRYELMFYTKIRVVSYNPLRRLFRSAYDRIEARMTEGLSALTGDSLTIAHFARMWLQNFNENRENLGRVKLIASLRGSGSGTAVLAGAGPSLDESVERIGRRKNSFFLIATDAAVKPLMLRGIRPDMIVTIDPQPSVWSHYAGLDAETLREIPAVLSLTANPRAFRMFIDRYLFFSSHPVTGLFPRSTVKGSMISGVGSVGSLALKISLIMGFERIVLVGCDHSYPGKRAYASGTFFSEHVLENAVRTRPAQTLETGFIRAHACETGQGECGGLLSSRNLLQYRREMEETAARSGDTVIVQVGSGLPLNGVARAAGLPESNGYRFRGKNLPTRLLEMCEAVDPNTRDMLACSLALRYRLLKNGREAGEVDAAAACAGARALLASKYGLVSP